MALSVLRDVTRNIQNGVFYAIMADEVIDSSDKGQFVVCLRWVDGELNLHEELIGLHLVPNICTDTVVPCIGDIFICINLTLKNCRGKCCHVTSNTSGVKSGVATQITAEEPRSIFTHYYGNSLQFVVKDMVSKKRKSSRRTWYYFWNIKAVEIFTREREIVQTLKEELAPGTLQFRTLRPTW